ncbi:MAG: PhnD/SsuA/transferrin family substrate-binding protein [Chloroflexi bacterium]|nr:PhnD/SsuA/transferrin family substrate-binding protein [Chloroflexota bacterium]
MRKNRTFLAFSLLLVASFVLGACAQATPTEAPVVPAEVPATEVPPPTEVPLGSPEMPIVMALAPSATSQELIAGGDAIAAKLSELTGYTITTTIPTSYAALVEAMGSGNAHIGWLPPLAYVLASQKGYADVVYVAIRSGSDYYGAQFIANVDSGFTSYFDAAANDGAGANTADAATALVQFDKKKPCWTDPLSASGYVTDPIIPNDNVSVAMDLPEDVRAKIVEALGTLASTEEGITLLKDGGYDISGLSARDDTFYDQFRVYLEASGIDVTTLVK